MKHFYYYPKIDYSNNSAVNILVRGKIRDEILSSTSIYYSYYIREGERPDIISSKYYGNPSYTWALFYANNIFNPLEQWPLDYRDFISYLEKKYGGIEPATQDIHHYEYYDVFNKKTYEIDKLTYDSYFGQYEQDSQQLKQVKEVSIYDYEDSLNERKKNIVVLDKQYLYQITNELSNLFK